MYIKLLNYTQLYTYIHMYICKFFEDKGLKLTHTEQTIEITIDHVKISTKMKVNLCKLAIQKVKKLPK